MSTPTSIARRIIPVLMASMALMAALPASALTLFDGKQVATVVHEDTPTAALAARLLARDLQAVSGVAPKVGTSLADCGQIGRAHV